MLWKVRTGFSPLLQYNTDLFNAERIATMLEQYQGLLEQVIDNPEERIANYSLLTPSQEKLLPDPTELLTPQWAGAVHTTIFRAGPSCSGARWRLSMLGELELW